MAQLVKNPPAMWENCIWSTGLDDPLEKGKATHSSILAWRIPWTVVHRVTKSWTQALGMAILYISVYRQHSFTEGVEPAWRSTARAQSLSKRNKSNMESDLFPIPSPVFLRHHLPCLTHPIPWLTAIDILDWDCGLRDQWCGFHALWEWREVI